MSELVTVQVAKIDPSPTQPRRRNSDKGLGELTDSIRKHGLLQPPVVRAKGDRFEIVLGDRRRRAIRKAA